MAPVEPVEPVGTVSTTTKPGLLKNLAYFLVHSIRCGGYMPWLLLLAAKYPLKTAVALLVRELLRRKTDTYNRLVHQFTAFGSSPEPRFVRRQSAPYDTKKQYIVTIHPHGVLCCPWFNLIARECPDFHEKNPLMDDLRLKLCIAPSVQFFPLHGEMYRDKVTDATSKTIGKILKETDLTPALAPGGFSEAIYSGSDPVKEYCFIEGRMGFLKLAIENKVDIIPTYSYGSTDMYQSIEWARHKRAVLAQKTGLPLVWWWGKNGTNVPFTEKVVTASFDPFPASQYTVDQLEQCHMDYKEYLQNCFDSYKHEAGYGHRELEFIGRAVPAQKYQVRSKL